MPKTLFEIGAAVSCDTADAASYVILKFDKAIVTAISEAGDSYTVVIDNSETELQCEISGIDESFLTEWVAHT